MRSFLLGACAAALALALPARADLDPANFDRTVKPADDFYEFATGWANIAVDQHEQVLKAIEARDSADAAEAMRKHIESGGEHAVARLTSMGFWN